MGDLTRAYDRQLERLRRREEQLFRRDAARRKGRILSWAEKRVPDKLMATMDAAFYTAFQVLFQRGTGLLGRTIPARKLLGERYLKEYAIKKAPGARSMGAFHRSAVLSGALTTAAATAEGCVLGLLGMGLPDIPILMSILLRAVYHTAVRYGLLGMGLPDIPILMSILLRAVYHTAVRYGFAYDTKGERSYILLLLCAALTTGPDRKTYSDRADELGRLLDQEQVPWGDLEAQMREAARALAGAMLVPKFLQGMTIIGVVGGASNFSTSRRVTEMANLKYQRRFLEKKRRKLTKA